MKEQIHQPSRNIFYDKYKRHLNVGFSIQEASRKNSWITDRKGGGLSYVPRKIFNDHPFPVVQLTSQNLVINISLRTTWQRSNLKIYPSNKWWLCDEKVLHTSFISPKWNPTTTWIQADYWTVCSGFESSSHRSTNSSLQGFSEKTGIASKFWLSLIIVFLVFSLFPPRTTCP